ncbi:MAG: hypothetical protein HOI66_16525, partial [Verrucomicrobia bacterium]|nr:hypothetical protein [Verrucomicrobiota bacterium]
MGSDAIRMRGDNGSIAVWNAETNEPDLRSLTARIREENGYTETGDVPGVGRFTIAYADEHFAHEKEFGLRFTRLEFDVSVIPNNSGVGDRSQSYVSAPIEFELSLWNPRPDSNFVGKTPFEVSLKDSSAMLVEIEDIVLQGDLNAQEAPIRAQGKHLIETSMLEGFFAKNGTFGPEKQKIKIRVYPQRDGQHEFQFRIPSDAGIIPVDVEVDVRLPDLAIGVPFIDSAPIESDVMIPVKGYLPVKEKVNQPALLGLNPFAQGGWILRNTRPAIAGGDGMIEQTGLGYMVDKFGRTGGLFTGLFDRPGDHVLELRLKNSPRLKTNPLVIKVFDPGSLTSWPKLDPNNNPHIIFSRVKRQLPARLVVGGYKFLSVTPEFAKPGERIRIRLQTYNGLGEAKPVGYTSLRGSKPDEYRNSTFVAAPFINSAGLLGYTDITFPETYQLEDGSAVPLYVDENGISVVEMKVPKVAPGLSGNVGLRLFPYLKNGSTWDHRGVSFSPQNKFLFEHPDTIFDERDGKALEFVPPTFSLAARYEDAKWDVLTTHETRLFGNGIYLTPNTFPLVSERVREKSKKGQLPADAGLVKVKLKGVGRFAQALASGITEASFGPGVSVESSIVSVTEAEFRLVTDPMVFNNSESLGVPREAKFVFGDGTVATTEFQLFKVEVIPRNPLANVDLPLNAQYGLHDPDIGFRSYRLQPGMMMLEFKHVPDFWALPAGPVELALELVPSIHAAWDSNMNGIADLGEDLNKDKLFDERDAGPNAARFRNGLAANPLVGFKRQFDKFGNPIVRGLKRRYLPGFPSLLRVYGNTEDRRRTTFDPKFPNKLGDLGDPDGLPDFVSAKQ